MTIRHRFQSDACLLDVFGLRVGRTPAIRPVGDAVGSGIEKKISDNKHGSLLVAAHSADTINLFENPYRATYGCPDAMALPARL